MHPSASCICRPLREVPCRGVLARGASDSLAGLVPEPLVEAVVVAPASDAEIKGLFLSDLAGPHVVIVLAAP